MNRVQSVRGMQDLLPAETRRWRYVEGVVADVFDAYGYEQIRTPLLEDVSLFKRSVGDATDIVEKEMYVFEDRGGETVALRPEGTASVVRAGEEHGLLFNQQQRLWYAGPMFRYERPQKGRYRQFEQIGAEVFGLAGPDVDAELLLLTRDIWQALGILEGVTLELNSMGTPASRDRYRKALVEYLEPYADDLDEDSRARLTRNPLRILDSKVTRTREIVAGAPRLLDWLDDESRAHFDGLLELLAGAGVCYRVNEEIVRGLDYYTGTVFEWTTEHLGAQGTVCGGGRYDGLVTQLGGKATPGIGFAMGVDRLVLLCDALSAFPEKVDGIVDLYVMPRRNETGAAFQVAARLRQALPATSVLLHHGGGKFDKRMKRALACGARGCVVVDEAWVNGCVEWRPFTGDDRGEFTLDALVARLNPTPGVSQ